jgi:hypothetical protein
MHKNAMKCNKTLRKWCKNKHRASKIIDTLETYHPDLRKVIFQEAHETPYSIHPGNTKMYMDLKERFW